MIFFVTLSLHKLIGFSGIRSGILGEIVKQDRIIDLKDVNTSL
jgi:hypothetical protein